MARAETGQRRAGGGGTQGSAISVAEARTLVRQAARETLNEFSSANYYENSNRIYINYRTRPSNAPQTGWVNPDGSLGGRLFERVSERTMNAGFYTDLRDFVGRAREILSRIRR